jgi:hypothetical protein
VSSENKYTFWLYFLRNNYEDVNKREWVVVIKQNNRLKGLKFIVNKINIDVPTWVVNRGLRKHPCGVISGEFSQFIVWEDKGIKYILIE